MIKLLISIACIICCYGILQAGEEKLLQQVKLDSKDIIDKLKKGNSEVKYKICSFLKGKWLKQSFKESDKEDLNEIMKYCALKLKTFPWEKYISLSQKELNSLPKDEYKEFNDLSFLIITLGIGRLIDNHEAKKFEVYLKQNSKVSSKWKKLYIAWGNIILSLKEEENRDKANKILSSGYENCKKTLEKILENKNYTQNKLSINLLIGLANNLQFLKKIKNDEKAKIWLLESLKKQILTIKGESPDKIALRKAFVDLFCSVAPAQETISWLETILKMPNISAREKYYIQRKIKEKTIKQEFQNQTKSKAEGRQISKEAIKKFFARAKKTLEYKGLNKEQIAEHEKAKKLFYENSLIKFKVFETPPQKSHKETLKIFKDIIGQNPRMRYAFDDYKNIPNYAELQKKYPDSEEAQILDAAFKAYVQNNRKAALAVLDKLKKSDKDPRFIRIKLRCLPGKKALPYLDELLKSDPKNEYYLKRKQKALIAEEGRAYTKSRTSEEKNELRTIGISKSLLAIDRAIQKAQKDKNTKKYEVNMKRKKKIEAYIKKHNITPLNSEGIRKAEKAFFSKSLTDVTNKLQKAVEDKDIIKQKFYSKQKKKFERVLKKLEKLDKKEATTLQ